MAPMSEGHSNNLLYMGFIKQAFKIYTGVCVVPFLCIIGPILYHQTILKADHLEFTVNYLILFIIKNNCVNLFWPHAELLEKLPLISDSRFIPQLLKEFSKDSNQKTWECEGLKALTQLTLAVTLSSLRVAPPNIQPQGMS